MSAHPDAAAFVRRYLRRPTDATTRLVFADWLEESGTPPNTAWSRYIRAAAEVDRLPPGSPARRVLEAEITGLADGVRATLTLPAAVFLGYPKSLFQLIPGPNITLRLDGHVVPRDVLERFPESVARENLVLPLQLQQRTLIVATADPTNPHMVDKLEFILNKTVILVGADPVGLRDAIGRLYGVTEPEAVDCVLYDYQPVEPDSESVSRLVRLMIRQAIVLGGERIHLGPRVDRVGVRYRIRGFWLDQEGFPRRLLFPIRDRVAQLAGLGPHPVGVPGGGEFRFDYHGNLYTIRAAIDSRAGNPWIDLDIEDEIELIN